MFDDCASSREESMGLDEGRRSRNRREKSIKVAIIFQKKVRLHPNVFGILQILELKNIIIKQIFSKLLA